MFYVQLLQIYKKLRCVFNTLRAIPSLFHIMLALRSCFVVATEHIALPRYSTCKGSLSPSFLLHTP
jgi:hypothetical protein